jgi:hypothetical protein
MIAQSDHPYLLEWLAKADRFGGGFISSIARAALVADPENYPLIKPLVEQMRKKYPQYEPSEQVQQELRPAVDEWIKRA